MGAVLLAHAKEVRDDGSVVEIVIWELPEPVPPSIEQLLVDFRADIESWGSP